MEKEYILYALGVAQALIFAGCGFIVRGHIGFSVRLTKLETMWSMISKQAAEILHSPHFRESGFDSLLEKLVRTYEDRHYELTIEEWNELQGMSQEVKENMEEPKGTRLLAAMVYAQCCHKLMLK